MPYQFVLLDELRSHATETLQLSDGLHEILRDSEIVTLGELYDQVQSGAICDVPGIAERRRETLAEALKQECIKYSSQSWRFFLRSSQWLYYLTVLALIALVLKLTVRNAFDRDEFAVLTAAFFTMAAYDSGRWASRSRVTSMPLQGIHIRSLLVFLSVPLTLVFATRHAWDWDQESLRVILCGLVLAVVSGGVAYFHGKIFAPVREKPSENPETIAERFKSLEPQVQAAYITGVFAIFCVLATFVADVVHTKYFEEPQRSDVIAPVALESHNDSQNELLLVQHRTLTSLLEPTQ